MDRAPTFIVDNQHQADQHRLVLHDPDITEYPVNSNVLYTPPTGRDIKVISIYKGPYHIAQQNEQEFVVERILAHRRDHHRRSTMEFLVQWRGYGEDSNSWEL